MLSNDALLQFDTDGNPINAMPHGKTTVFIDEAANISQINPEIVPFRPVAPMISIQVGAVLSSGAGFETIEQNQLATKKNHYGKIYVHTKEFGYGDHWADVTLGGKKMRPLFNVPEDYKQYEGPIHNASGMVVGWNRVWEIDFSNGGVFYIDQWSINGSHIKPHVSDYLYIL